MKLLTADYSTEISVGSYRIDSDRRLRIEEYRGTVGLGDLRDVATAMASDPCWSPAFHGLVDFSRARLEMTANEVLRLSLLLRQKELRSTGWLVYVAQDPTTFGILRMLGYWSRNTSRLRIFDTRQAAEAWLHLNADYEPARFLDQDELDGGTALRDAI